EQSNTTTTTTTTTTTNNNNNNTIHMLNISPYICTTVTLVTIMISLNNIGRTDALKCLVCANCTNNGKSEIKDNCISCRNITRLRNNVLNTLTRECLYATCKESVNTTSPWRNTTNCCKNRDLCNESSRLVFNSNHQITLSLLIVSTLFWLSMN
uniref:Uncharacterized protein n=1 Tax=Trichobilharzia regenti TaxID=157069 RepID=A0AA85J7K6_TRIRE